MKNILITASLISLITTSCNLASDKAPGETQKEVNQIQTISMEKQDYTATILVDQSPTVAFDAAKNFRGWWSEQIEGPTDQLNEVFFYHYKDIHLCKIKLIEMVPDKKLVYQVLENEFNFTKDKTEWVNTKLIFEISKEGNKTKLKFTHEGLVPEYECFRICNDAWTGYITKSLYNLITKGQESLIRWMEKDLMQSWQRNGI